MKVCDNCYSVFYGDISKCSLCGNELRFVEDRVALYKEVKYGNPTAALQMAIEAYRGRHYKDAMTILQEFDDEYGFENPIQLRNRFVIAANCMYFSDPVQALPYIENAVELGDDSVLWMMVELELSYSRELDGWSVPENHLLAQEKIALRTDDLSRYRIAKIHLKRNNVIKAKLFLEHFLNNVNGFQNEKILAQYYLWLIGSHDYNIENLLLQLDNLSKGGNIESAFAKMKVMSELYFNKIDAKEILNIKKDTYNMDKVKFQVRDGIYAQEWTPHIIAGCILTIAADRGVLVDVEITTTKMKSSGFFSKKIPCVVVTHPERPEYLSHVITVEDIKNQQLINFMYYGDVMYTSNEEFNWHNTLKQIYQDIWFSKQ